MIFLIIATILCTVVSLPAYIKFGLFVSDDKSNALAELLSLLGYAAFVIALSLFMASVGHGIVALIILIPSIVAFIVGFTVGAVEASR